MEPITMLLGAAALYGGYKVFVEKKPRFVGDLAKVGDEVVASVNNLMQINKNLPTLPPNTDFLTIEVQGADKDRLQGPIVAMGGVRIPAKVGSFTVHRVIVDKVIRNGKVATAPVGPGSNFTGESRRHFRG